MYAMFWYPGPPRRPRDRVRGPGPPPPARIPVTQGALHSDSDDERSTVAEIHQGTILTCVVIEIGRAKRFTVTVCRRHHT